MTLLRIVGIDPQLAEPADPVHDGVAMNAEPFGGFADAPAVEQRLKGRDELEAARRRS